MKCHILLLSAFFCFYTHISGQIYIGETEVDTATVITGLDIPWEIQWGPDDHLWITERFGRVSRIDPESGQQDIILDISDVVYQYGESGLLGMVLHPGFEDEPYVFMAYTYRPDGSILERIVRYEYDGNSLLNEFILLDNIQGNTTHDGCRLIILPDTTLLFTTGDAQNQPAAQDLDHLSGKILRLNLDGSIPDNNPFPNNPVYSFGHRNAQGLYYSSNGLIYSSEHGPSTDDEFNIIEPGRNYGWPNVHGFCNLPDEQVFCENNNVFEPLAAWTPTIATSDIILYDHSSIPEWQDKILMTTLKNKRIYVLELNEEGTSIVGEEHFFTDWWGRLRDICQAPDGSVYLATNGSDWGNSDPFTHSIIRIWNPDNVSVPNFENNSHSTVSLTPNPAHDFIKIDVSNNFVGHHVKIYSIKGNLIFKQLIDSSSFRISTDSLAYGTLVFVIESEKEILFSKKILITD